MTALSCKANRMDANRNTNIYSLLALVSIYPEGRPGRPNSEGGITFVTFFDDKEGTVDVQYTINNCESQDILPTQISSATLTSPTCHQSPDERTWPSIFIHCPRRWGQHPPSHGNPPPRPRLRGFAKKFQESSNWDPAGRWHHPMFRHLKNGRNKDAGLMRREEVVIDGHDPGKLKKQLATPEKCKLMDIEILCHAISPSKHPPRSHPFADHAHAWGIKPRSLKQTHDCLLEQNGECKRKKWSNTGQTVFNSNKRHDLVLKPFEVFKRSHRIKNPGESLVMMSPK